MSTPTARRIEVPGHGAEDVVVADDGTVYTGTDDGVVHRIAPDGRVSAVGSTGGRPLGLELLGDDRLLVADAHRGLLAMHLATGECEELVAEVDGRPMRFCNNATVAANGDIWFSDSSTVHSIEAWKDEFVQNTRTGRLMCRRADGSVEVHLEHRGFCNGVALAADESFVCVAMTAERSVVRLWLTGERAGESDVFADDLPGYPDNMALGTDGLFWVAIASPRDPVVDWLRLRAPMAVRRLVTRLPEATQPKPKRTLRVQAYDADGTLVHDVDAEASGFHMATGVREHHGKVWIGSLVETAVAVLRSPGAPV